MRHAIVPTHLRRVKPAPSGSKLRPVASNDARVSLASELLRHLDSLYNFARHLSGRDTEAEDLVQETCARALTNSDQFEPSSNVRAWLYRILRNAFIDGYRRQARELASESVEDEASLPMLRDDFELDSLRGIVASEIERALQSLSEPSRLVILLDLEGWSEDDIASVAGCPTNTVKSRLFRARHALRAQLKDYTR